MVVKEKCVDGGNLCESNGNLERLLIVNLSYCNLGKLPEFGTNLDIPNSSQNQLPKVPAAASSKLSIFKNVWRKISAPVKKSSFDQPSDSIDLYFSPRKRISKQLCDVDPEYVVELNLQNNSKFFLTKEILNFSNLEKLNLSDSGIDFIPPFLFLLSKLKILNLAKNNLSRLPNEISQSNLKTLILNDNKFYCGFLKKLCQIETLQNLQCNFNGIFGHIPTEFSKLSNLEVLEMHYCCISNFENLLKNSNLTYLDLSANEIAEIPTKIYLLSKLQSLVIYQNKICEIDDSFCKLESLSTLNLSANFLKKIPDTICDLHNLQYLDLSKNQITQIPTSLNLMNNLKHLDLSKNFLDSLPRDLSGTSKLEWIDISSNHFDESIFDILIKVPNLKYLACRNNKIKFIPNSVSNFESLRELSCQNNQIVFIQNKVKFKKLEILNLACNLLTMVPESVMESSCLAHLKIFENQCEKFPKTRKEFSESTEAFVYCIESEDNNALKLSNSLNSQDGNQQCKKVSFPNDTNKQSSDSLYQIGHHSESITMSIQISDPNQLGISIQGGTDSLPSFEGNYGIFIQSIQQNCDLYNYGLRKMDRILSLNGKSLQKVKHSKAIEAFKSLPCEFLIEVLPQFYSALDIIKVFKPNESIGIMITSSREVEDFPFGFTENKDKMIEGIYVAKIFEQSPAEKAESLRIGDRIIRVNDESLEGKTLKQATDIFFDLINCDLITLHVQHLGLPLGFRNICIIRETKESSFGLEIIGGTDSPFQIHNYVHSGIYIKSVLEDSPADKFEETIVGSQIIAVNNISVLGVSHHDALDILKNSSVISEFSICFGINADVLSSIDGSQSELLSSPAETQVLDQIPSNLENPEVLSPNSKPKFGSFKKVDPVFCQTIVENSSFSENNVTNIAIIPKNNDENSFEYANEKNCLESADCSPKKFFRSALKMNPS